MGFVEYFPKISITFLKRMGVFRPDAVGTDWSIKSDSQVFQVSYSGGTTIFFQWQSDGKTYSQVITLAEVPLRFGHRRYFFCPITWRKCLDLYLAGAQLGSRLAFGLEHASRGGSDLRRWRANLDRRGDRLLGLDGKGPARGHNRQALAGALERTPFITMFHEVEAGVYDALLAERRRQRGKTRSRRQVGDQSTTAALEAGLTFAEGGEEARLAHEWAQSVAADPPNEPVLVARSGAPAFVEDHPALDMRVLTKAWKASSRPMWSGLLQWNSPPEGGVLVMLTVADWRDEAAATLILHSPQMVEEAQLLRLVRSHPNTPPRWLVLCPVTGKRSDVLFWREGSFASRTAQRLIHRSQRAG